MLEHTALLSRCCFNSLAQHDQNSPSNLNIVQQDSFRHPYEYSFNLLPLNQFIQALSKSGKCWWRSVVTDLLYSTPPTHI